MNKLEFEFPKTAESGFTALETDLFKLMGLYAGSDCKLVVFDSGCTLAVTTFKSDFEGPINPVEKHMNVLETTAKVTGEGSIA